MKTRSLLCTTLIASTLGVCAMPAWANTKDENQYYSSILEAIKTAVQGTQSLTTEIVNMMTATPKDAGTNIIAWASMNTLEQTQSLYTQAGSKSLDATFSSNDTLAKSVDRAFSINTKAIGGYSSLSAYSLLGLTHTSYNNHDYYTKTYNKDQAAAAGNYVRFLSGSAIPVQQPDGKTLKDKEQINLIRTMQAVQSLDAYNLSKVYAARLPVASTADLKLKGIGTPSGKISQEGLTKYLLQSQINSPQWHQKMETASPFTVMRQGVILMGAAVSELYKIEQNQEQMIITQTATNTATLAMAKEMLAQANQANELAERAKQS